MVVPTRDGYDQVLQRSCAEWEQYLHNARSLAELPAFALMPSLPLRRVLSFPTWDQQIPKIVNDDCLDMQGQAIWKIEKPENCDLEIIVRRLIVGVPRPTHCTIQASRVHDTYFAEALHKPENHIGILVLA